ncbi:MAG: hypothetical protein ACE5L6_08400 [Candidatus Bathyarchaeia archaeon]
MNSHRLTVKLSGAAVLAPLSVVLQVFAPLFLTPWYMRIDLVAVPWILCWILFGLEAALLSLAISVPLVGVLGPFAGGWVGATMKSVASIWMFLIPAIFAWKTGGTKRLLENRRLFALAGVLAIAVRALVTLLFNFYFALPFFFGWTPSVIIDMFSEAAFLSFVGNSLGLIGLGAFITEVAFWNTIQGIIDLSASSLIGLVLVRTFPGLTIESLNE